MAHRAKTEGLKQQVGEVKVIVADNLEKIEMRGDRIEEMDERAALLGSAAKDFKKVTVKTRKKQQRIYNKLRRCCCCARHS